MKMKKAFLSLLVAVVATLTIGGIIACKNTTKLETGTLSESDSVAVASAELPRTLADAPAPKGNITTWLIAGMSEGGDPRMFIVENDKGQMTQANYIEHDEDTIYVLRLVSYEQTLDETEKLEEGGTSRDIEGNLVVDAYDHKTQAFVGRYEGQYTSSGEYDAEGELVHCGETYGGTFTYADGKKEEFSYYGD